MLNIFKDKKTIIYFVCLIIFNSVILFHFHDKFWLPQDEGVFAHIADRMLQGEILHRDIEEVHPGYNGFVNYFAFKVFGRDLLSLRYPLVLIAFLQSIILFLLLRKKIGNVGSFIGGLAPTTLGITHFLNPNHHWYCLFLVIALIGWLSLPNISNRWRYFIAGIFIVSIYLFRQLSGFYIGVGVINYLFLEQSHKERLRGSIIAPIILSLFFLLQFLYLIKTIHISTFILYGIGPLLFMVYSIKNISISRKSTFDIIIYLLAGTIMGLIPIIFYHAHYHSLNQWFQDSFIRALTVTKQPFLKNLLFTEYICEGAKLLIRPKNFSEFLNGMYWLLLPLSNLFLSILILQKIVKEKAIKWRELLLPVLALFYALVTTHNSSAVYMYFSLGLTIPALLLITVNRRVSHQILTILIGLFSVIALYFHSTQPLLVRNFIETIEGRRIAFVKASETFQDMNLSIDPGTFITYKKLIHLIQKETNPNDTIFVLPNNAEIYYLSQRKNPFRFFSTDHGVQNENELATVLNILKTQPPKLIIFKAKDKRITDYSQKIMDYVKNNYDLVDKIVIFDVYKSNLAN